MSKDGARSAPTAIAPIADELLPGPVAVLLCGDDGRVAFANAAAARLFGVDPTGRPVAELVADGPSAVSPSAPIRFGRLDGSDFWAFAAVQERALGCIWQIFEVDAYVRERDKLAYQESIWRHAIEAAEHGVWDYNANNEGQFYSDAWKAMRGFPVGEEVRDSNEAWEARLHPDDLASVREHVRQQNSGEIDHFNFEYRERRQDGRWIWILARGRTVEWDQDGKPTRLIGTDIDITSLKEEEARRAAEVEAIYQRHLAELETASKAIESARREAAALARADPLSGLANRRAFAEEIARRSAAHDGTQGFAVILIDLDRFKPINDMHGHAVGDLVIRQAAIRLDSALREGGVVARLGGDEFGVILPHDGGEHAEAAAGACAQRLIAELGRPFWVGEFAVEIGASVGLAVSPRDSTNADTLFRYADMALYEAKNTARGTWRPYSASLGKAAETRAALEADVRRAAAEEQIQPFFQPIVDMGSGNIVKLEMLARWRHPVHGWVGPDRFIPVIEQSGKIADFTLSMLRRACRAAKAWPTDISIVVNLTTREVCDLATPLRLLGVAMDCGFPATRLEVEITERTIVKDFAAAKQVIGALRSAGVKVLLDDFGAGYAGLGYLRELAFDGIKIDSSFISSLAKPESFKITKAMQGLAESLGLATVAEGIENLEIWRAVQQLSCTYGQGYYIARPMPAGEISALLGRGAKGLSLAG